MLFTGAHCLGFSWYKATVKLYNKKNSDANTPGRCLLCNIIMAGVCSGATEATMDVLVTDKKEKVNREERVSKIQVCWFETK